SVLLLICARTRAPRAHTLRLRESGRGQLWRWAAAFPEKRRASCCVMT
ncbi:hypothetical protein IRJ41_024679, partial [Triplophysa rosa]